MHNFELARPKGLADAKAAFAASGDGAWLAGGHTLIPAMKARLRAPETLVDLGRVPELTGMGILEDRLYIGAMTTHATVAGDRIINQIIPALAKLASLIGDPQVRNRGTLGGALANNDPASDYPAACVALDAIIQTDRAKYTVADFFQGMFATALSEDELIVRVGFRVPLGGAYAKFRHPVSRYALAGIYVARHVENEVRVAVTGAGPAVFRWTEAEVALAAEFSENAVAGLTLDPDMLNADFHASGEYRVQLCKVMLAQAVREAV